MARIFVCYHKPAQIIQHDEYIPIQCGRSHASCMLDMIGDNTRNNISNKNSAYSELTVLYWIWKNATLNKTDILGLCHYRRFFDFHNKHILHFGVIKYKTAKLDDFNLSIPDKIKRQVANGTVVVPKPRRFAKCNMESMSSSLPRSIISKFESYFISSQSKEMCYAYNEVMYKRCFLFPYNMFLMCSKDIDTYCSWLFPLFEDFEKQINMSMITKQRMRVFGYLSERLFNVWLYKEKKDIVQIPVVWFDDNTTQPQSLGHKISVLLKTFGL